MKSVKSVKWSLLAIAVLALGSLVFSVPAFATTGMSNCTQDPEREDCNPQPDRVGNDGRGANNNDADRDGPGGADNDPNDNDEGEQNCWGKVTSSLAHNEGDDEKPGIGEHSSDPRPGDDDNETPREGVGNQAEGHPSDHADTVGGLADDVPDCVD